MSNYLQLLRTSSLMALRRIVQPLPIQTNYVKGVKANCTVLPLLLQKKIDSKNKMTERSASRAAAPGTMLCTRRTYSSHVVHSALQNKTIYTHKAPIAQRRDLEAESRLFLVLRPKNFHQLSRGRSNELNCQNEHENFKYGQRK